MNKKDYLVTKNGVLLKIRHIGLAETHRRIVGGYYVEGDFREIDFCPARFVAYTITIKKLHK